MSDPAIKADDELEGEDESGEHEEGDSASDPLKHAEASQNDSNKQNDEDGEVERSPHSQLEDGGGEEEMETSTAEMGESEFGEHEEHEVEEDHEADESGEHGEFDFDAHIESILDDTHSTDDLKSKKGSHDDIHSDDHERGSTRHRESRGFASGGFDDDIFGDTDWKVLDDTADLLSGGDYSDDEGSDDGGMAGLYRELSDWRSSGLHFDDDDIFAHAVTSQEELDNLLQIPEEPAREKMDILAKDPGRKPDPILKYHPPPDSDGHDIIPASDPRYVSKAASRVDKCPSIESFFRLKKMIDVHFYLHPGGKMISRDCRLDATVFQIKNAISQFVQVPADHLDLRRKRNLVADQRTLMELGAGPKTKMKFTVEINKRIPGNYRMKLPKDKEIIEPRHETRTVSVTNSKGVSTKVQVQIEYPTEPRPKLGGYTDTRTGIKFLHAMVGTTTMDVSQWELSDQHKACQSFNDKHASTQTRVDTAQQMDRDDYYVSQAYDRTIRAKRYITFEEMEAKRKVAIITIQRYWRGWLARQERKMRLEGLIKRIEWAEKIRKGRIDQRYAIMDDEISRQECPKKLVDIELLYRAINLWRKEQEEYVMKNRWGAERKAALAVLTEMEADLLLDLERTRKRIKDNGRERMIETQFNRMGKPKRWLGKSETFITMDTKERLNVRQLHHTYRDLKANVLGEGDEPQENSLTLEERLELLGRVNEMIKKVTSKLGVMLSDLITRELTYLRINCSKTLMLSLRNRIASCFFLLCQDPIFNPEAKRLQKVPFDYTKLRKDMVQCKGCRRMWYRDEFTIQRGTTVTTRCHMCMGLYRTAILRVDLNLYRHMLDELRKDELAAGVTNSVTFLIDAFDLQFLVEQIWHGQSALSGIDNRYLLRLCRWIRKQPWTPWNCVLLTEEEAVSHTQLDNMNDAYRDSFFHKVFVKQCTAKTYFEGLGKLAVGLDEKIAEGCARYWEKEKNLKLAKEKFKKKMRLIKFLTIK